MSLSPKEHLDEKLNSKEHMEQFEEGENYKKGKKVERKYINIIIKTFYV